MPTKNPRPFPEERPRVRDRHGDPARANAYFFLQLHEHFIDFLAGFLAGFLVAIGVSPFEMNKGTTHHNPERSGVLHHVAGLCVKPVDR
jgi:hypothetical protein